MSQFRSGAGVGCVAGNSARRGCEGAHRQEIVLNPSRTMSEMGQPRKWRGLGVMSALPPTADVRDLGIRSRRGERANTMLIGSIKPPPGSGSSAGSAAGKMLQSEHDQAKEDPTWPRDLSRLRAS
jgi:hypothetical protein